MPEIIDPRKELTEESLEEFGELLRFTFSGFTGGIALGLILDFLGYSKSGLGQWLVRTVSGEGESLLEGIFAIKKRISGHTASMAEAYGWGKLLGMAFPWIVDLISRASGIDVYGVTGFYIPYFYAMSDQIGGNASGLIFLHKHTRGWLDTIISYITHPVMLSGLIIIFLAPAGLALSRMAGFSPSNQVLTATETIAANLCRVPPLLGWLYERSRVKK